MTTYTDLQKFWHRFILNFVVTFVLNFQEVTIQTKITNSNHFAKCNNINCSSIFPIQQFETITGEGIFCPDCQVKLATQHIIQCKVCLSIVGFMEPFTNEESMVFYVEKCSCCNGTIEDEKRLTPYLFPDAFI